MNIAIIPARIGSKRIKKKNIKLFLGKPIIQFTIEKLIKMRFFNQIYISSVNFESLNDETKNMFQRRILGLTSYYIGSTPDKFAEKIFISSNILNNNWKIEIEDNGPGTNLSQEQLIRPFVKGSDQLNQGTGLGLSIVQKLIKLNNGELNFQKSSHGGLKVTVILQI